MTTELTLSKTPSGPRGSWLLGSIGDIRRAPLEFLLDTSRGYGPVARYRLGPMAAYLVTDPAGVRRVLHDNARNYTKQDIGYKALRWVVGNGIFTSNGAFWQRQRKLTQPAFQPGRLAGFADRMATAAQDMLDAWQTPAGRGEPIDVAQEMTHLTLRVVGEVLFGAALTRYADQVAAAFTELGEQIVQRFRAMRMLPPILPTRYDRRFRAALASLDDVVHRIIAERRRTPGDRGDLLSMYMLARDADTGEQMTDAQLRDEVITLLIAGNETTATGLGWVWVVLRQHPEVERRLHAELDAVLAGRLPGLDDLPRLPYLRAVIDETLRLYPPVYVFSRKAVARDELCGYRIPAGSIVHLSPWATHRNAAYWDDPEVFRPERFLDAGPRDKYAYFPFGGGPRVCIGRHFALLETQLVVASVARRVRLCAPAAGPVLPDPAATLRQHTHLAVIEHRQPQPASRAAGQGEAR